MGMRIPPNEIGRSEVIDVPATEDVFLTRDILRQEYNVGECNDMVERALLDKTHAACEPCQHLWVEFGGGLEQNIFQHLGRQKASVPFSRVLWHLKQQRDGQEGLLLLKREANTRFFVPEIKGVGIVTLHWYADDKCWGVHAESLDYDETDPLMDKLRFIIQP